MRFFASAQPGFGPLLAEEIAETGAAPSAPVSDGRSDLVGFELRGTPDVLHTAEDVFAEVAWIGDGHPLGALANALIDPAGLERALSAYASAARPLRARESYRVIVRVTSERDFLRTQLRDALHERVVAVRPRWRPDDPAGMELWALQTTDGWLCGLRLTSGRRSDRTEERPGALRPSIAATMVRLAGSGRRLLDPCCGSGTILASATASGWSAYGADVDRLALDVARTNTRAPLLAANVTSPPFVDGSFDAIVSNLPFGKRFAMDAPVALALTSLDRVLTTTGRLVVLTARDAPVPPLLRIERRFDVELLGQPATLWVLHPDVTHRPDRAP